MPLSPSPMASIPQFYSNCTFPTDLTELPTQGVAPVNGNTPVTVMDNAMWGQENNSNIVPVVDNGALDHAVSLDHWDAMSSAWMMPTFSEQQLGMSVSHDLLAVPAAVSDCRMGFYGGDNAIAGFQSFSCGFQQHVGEFGEDVKPPPAYPISATENWVIQGNQVPASEEPNIKVERYSEEERKERILRYLKKRNQRNFNKTIKYACRKTLADRRVRVRGRFARNNELCLEDMATKKLQNHHQEDFYGGDIQFQLKNDDEGWLQEAMASLVYLSHSSPDDV